MPTYGVLRGLAGDGITPGERDKIDEAVAAAEDLAVALPQVDQAREDAQAAAGQAASALQAAVQERQAAEAAAVAAALRAGYYDTIAEGRTAVADGESFAVRAGGADGLTRPTIYRRDSATAQTAMVTIVNPSEVDANLAAQNTRITKVAGNVSGLHNTSVEQPFELTDETGNVFHRINSDFVSEFFGGAQFDGREHTWPFAVTDEEGNVVGGYRDGRWYFPGLEIDSSLDRLDQRNRDRSMAIMSAPRIGVQMPVTQTSIIAMLGQSIGEGSETWPSLSKVAVPGTMMMGSNVECTSTQDAYTFIGSASLAPLVASTPYAGVILSAAQEAALVPGDQHKGEPPVIGLTRGLKSWRNRRALLPDDGHQVIAINPAVAGMTIEKLSKVSSDGVNRYALVTDGIGKVSALAPGAVVPVLGFAQGEFNYPSTYGGDTTRAGYREKLSAYLDDVVADIAALLPDQADPPLIVSYQTGASYTVDLDANGQPGLAIGMAQLDLALSDPRVVMSGPAYPYTDKGGHLDANGSRWMGHQMARAASEVWAGRNFQPTRPLEIVADGIEILLHYHVPVPPLVFDTPYVISAPTDYAAKGYRVTSAAGTTSYAIQAVEIVRPTIVKLTLSAPPPADALVWYASKAVSNGNGCVRDSDPRVATDHYEYVPDRGMYPAANIPELVGRPYPLHNWSVAFCLPLNYSEF